MFEAGYYNGAVSGQGFSTSKQKGTPSFDIQVVVQEKINSVTQEKSPVTQAKRTIANYITPTTMEPEKGGTYAVLKALGVYGDFADYDPDQPNHRSLVGTPVRLHCRHEEYKGEPKEVWRIVTGTGKPRNDAEAVKKLAVLSLPPLPPPPPVSSNTEAPAAPPAAPPVDATTGDLPF